MTVKVTADDSTHSVSDTFDIVVRTEANQVPTVANAIANQPAVVGTAFDFTFAVDTFNDANSGDTLSYTATQDDGTALPAWLSLAADTRTFSGTPQTADVGTVTVKVTANDGTDSVSDTFDIVVRTEANQVPAVANEIPDQPATAGTAFSFTFGANTFSDANGDTLSYTATQDGGTALPAWLTFAAGTRTFSGTPRTADVGTLTVKVTANDGTDSVSDTFEIVVGADVTAPTVTISGVPASINATTALTVTFAWSEDVTGFVTGDVTVSGGTKGTFTAVDGSSYTLTVTPSGNASVVVTVAADAATDDGSNTGPAEAVEATGLLGVCLRTSAVRDAIVVAVDGKTECGAVTKADLEGVTGTLFVSSQSITALKSGDFAGLTALTQIDLQGNSLSSLPSGVFDELTALTGLDLGVNRLSSLPAGVFDELTALTTLYLWSNDLSSLPSGVFDELTALTDLGLQHNRLRSLPSGVFDELTTLTTLYLSGNWLSSLPAGVFGGLAALTELNLSDNRLSSLPSDVFDDLTALTTLLLHNNRLSSLPVGVFGGLTALTELNLTGNAGRAVRADGGCGADRRVAERGESGDAEGDGSRGGAGEPGGSAERDGRHGAGAGVGVGGGRRAGELDLHGDAGERRAGGAGERGGAAVAAGELHRVHVCRGGRSAAEAVREQRADGGERHCQPAGGGGHGVRIHVRGGHVQRRGQRHAELHGEEGRRHGAARLAEFRGRHAHVLRDAADGGRGHGDGEGDGRRRPRRLGERHVRHRGADRGQQRADGGDRDIGPDGGGGHGVQLPVCGGHVQRHEQRRHAELHGEEGRRHGAARLAEFRGRHAHVLGDAADGGRGHAVGDGDGERRHGHGERHVRDRGGRGRDGADGDDLRGAGEYRRDGGVHGDVRVVGGRDRVRDRRRDGERRDEGGVHGGGRLLLHANGDAVGERQRGRDRGGGRGDRRRQQHGTG